MPFSKERYRASPIGVARNAWINRPDTKFNADGIYHTDLILEGEDAAAFKETLDAFAQKAFDHELEDLKPGERKKWSIYVPYEEEVDEDNGSPTGRIAFRFKQNAKIRLPDGSTKTMVMGVRDSKDKASTADVYGGAVIRVLWKPRSVKMDGLKKAGVRMDFLMVQLIKPAPSRGGGFDEVEGGYVDEGGGEDLAPTKGSPKAGDDGDY